MAFFLILALLYFLPSILAYNKRNAAGIILVNLFLGWTIIGWVVALFWACTSEPNIPMIVAGAGRYCPCGTVNITAAHYCASCGRPV